MNEPKRAASFSASGQKKRGGKRKLSGLQIAVIALGAVVFLCAASFGGYLIYEEVQYQRALENYPVAYTDLISEYAEQYDLDPYLVQAIMRCESSNDRARSATGARSG